MADEVYIGISSPPDRNLLVADIMIGSEQLAEINFETGKFVVELYAREDGGCWSIDFDTLSEALKEAKERLAASAGGDA